jgi:hypothetical protein
VGGGVDVVSAWRDDDNRYSLAILLFLKKTIYDYKNPLFC